MSVTRIAHPPRETSHTPGLYQQIRKRSSIIRTYPAVPLDTPLAKLQSAHRTAGQRFSRQAGHRARACPKHQQLRRAISGSPVSYTKNVFRPDTREQRAGARGSATFYPLGACEHAATRGIRAVRASRATAIFNYSRKYTQPARKRRLEMKSRAQSCTARGLRAVGCAHCTPDAHRGT